MRKFTILISTMILSLFLSVVQGQVWTLDFETATGYTTSIPEFTDTGADFWIRTDGTDHGGYVVYNGVVGTYYFAGMDIDGEGATLPVYINIDDIDISGETNLELRIYLAEDQSSDGNEDWDAADYFHVGYDIDNSGSFTPLLWVESSLATNGFPLIDTDFDGIGDGTEVTENFVQFIVSIAGTGSLLDLELEFNLNSGDEDIAIDHLEIYAGGGNSLPAIANVAQTPSIDITPTTTVSVSADVTDSDGTVDLVELNWGTTSGLLSNSIAMTNGGSGDTYTTSTDIPAQAVGTTVYYEVYAEDNIGDGSVSVEYSYTVIDAQTTTIPYAEPFDADLGQCYTKSVSGATKDWHHATYGGNGFADMNGYNSGDTEEDWLILPGIDFDSYSNEIMSFDTWYQYGTDDATNYLKLYYSDDYPGIGDPTGYTWAELTYTQGASQAWTSSGNIDLSGITGTSVYIALKYHYEVGNYRHWEIDNLSIVESAPVNVTFQVNMADETVSGDGVHIAGDFNGWDPAATLMTDPDLDDIYTVTLSLNSNIEYQFKYLNGNAWGTEEIVPVECQAPGTTNRFEVVTSPDYSIPVVCFGSCADCGTLFDYDITFQVDMQNETVSGDVYLAGSFNGWTDQVMTNTGGTIYELTVTLTEGSYHEYKFKNGAAGWEGFNGSCVVWDGGNRFMTTPSANTTLDLVCFNSCDACPVSDFVIINEVDADTPGTDALEFIELYDGGIGNTDLSGLVVVLYNGSDDQSYNDAIDLDGYFTDANGYFVIGSATVPNVDLAAFTTNGIQNGADAVALFIGDGTAFPNDTPITTANLLDALVYDTNDGDDAALLALLNAGEPQINEAGRGNSGDHSNQRIPNGSGGQRNTSTYDQSYPTPGVENTLMFTDWTGVIDSDWDNAGNWHNGIPDATLGASIPEIVKASSPVISGSATCMSLFMAFGSSLEIATSGSLTVIGTFSNNGNVTIRSDATGTGSLIENNGVYASVERYYNGGQWHLISSPVSGETANLFFGLYLQNHDEPTNLYYDIVDETTPLNVMQGYALWDYNTGTATFAGTVNTGALSVGLTRTAAGAWDYGWNLVGNPYPSSIDWLAASGWTKTNVGGTIYLYTGSTWATFSIPGSGTNGGTQYVAPGQGFFVNVNDDGSTTGTLGMDNIVRAHNATNFFKDELNNVLKLQVAANGYTDETSIIFMENATAGFDAQFDAHKLFSLNNEVPQIYSTANGFMAANILPEITSVAIDVKANDGESLTITAVETSEFEHVYLEDLYTGIVIDLNSEDYTFTWFDGVQDRFIVHFAPLAVDNNLESNINVYSHHQDVFVRVPENTEGEIFVYNMMGQAVVSIPINGSLNKVTLKESAYYLVKVISNESTVTQKVFIK